MHAVTSSNIMGVLERFDIVSRLVSEWNLARVALEIFDHLVKKADRRKVFEIACTVYLYTKTFHDMYVSTQMPKCVFTINIHPKLL